MRVLIIKATSLSDIIHALPLLDFLKQVSPDIEIDWVADEGFRELLDGNPLISRLHLIRTRSWRKRLIAPSTWHEIGGFMSELRERQYRIVFDVQGDLASGVVCWLTGAPSLLGFSREHLKEGVNTFFTNRQVSPRTRDHHATDQCLRLVSAPFGKDFRGMTLHVDIPTSSEDDVAASTLLATLGDGLVFLFHYGTPWQTKLWSKNGWVELGRHLLAKYPEATILFSWGDMDERDKVANISESIGSGARVIDQYTLKGLAALLKKVDLVVGGDAGPIHVAAAVGTPTVSLFRSTDGLRIGPRGSQHVVIQAPLDCSCCYRKKCSRNRECSESITAGMVISAVEKVLGRGA
jgi:heptosyltransferase-1